MVHIVDDTDCVREVLVDFMESLGWKVDGFPGPLEYLAYLGAPDHRKPSLVITDVHMPEMDGYEMMDKVLAAHPDVKFIVISGEPGIESRFKDRACGYLTKPMRLDVLASLVDTLDACDGGVEALSKFSCRDCGERRAFGVCSESCPKLGVDARTIRPMQ